MMNSNPSPLVESTKPLPPEEIEEVNPLALMVSLERDNAIMQAALKKIKRTRPMQFSGGSSNRNFGRRHEQAFTECKSVAVEALKRLENYNE